MNCQIRGGVCLLLVLFSLPYPSRQLFSGGTCDFENLNECSWYFTNSYDLGRILKAQRASPSLTIPQRPLHSSREPYEDGRDGSKENNFHVVVSGGSNVSNHYAYFLSRKPSDNVAMIVSPFYDSTSPKCELAFRHRILGESGAELLVTTEQLTLSHAHVIGSEAEDDDWIRPTLRTRFIPVPNINEPWMTSQVAIGKFDYPTRIRLECHASGENNAETDLNVECHVDDLQLLNCEEELYETDTCNNYKSENLKYSCRSSGNNICLRYEALCDMHTECDNDDDENDDLHSCLSLPLGARCNFEDKREPAGCSGWRFFSGHSINASNAGTHLVSVSSPDSTYSNRNGGSAGGVSKFVGLPPSEYVYNGKVYRPGRFLFFTTYNYATANDHEIVYTSAVSPHFPPIFANASTELPACMLRFFYCQIGSNPFQIFVVSDQRRHEPKPLWSPPTDETNAAHCDWRKGHASIRPGIDIVSGADYYLKLSFVKIPGSVGSIAIDDLALTPSCAKHFPNWKPQSVSVIDDRDRPVEVVLPTNSDDLLIKNSFIEQFYSTHIIIIIFLFNAFVIVLVAVICCIWRRVINASAKNVFHINDHEMMRISTTSATGSDDASSRCVGNCISGNPIYETLQISNLAKISRHNLQMKRIIGHGAFGEVYEAYYFHNGQRMTVALKSLQTESCKDVIDDFETEARLLSQFKHENIVAFYGISFEQQPRYIVFEYLKGGDLRNYLRENRPKFGPGRTSFLIENLTVTMSDLVGFALDVAKACEHLEATKFVHRDIAARNCLLVSKEPGERVVKIADFGMARDIYHNDYYRKGGKAFLPVRWMPPEAFLDGVFTTKTDVWAFGVLLWEIFSMGYVPYSGRDNHEVMKLVVAGDRLDPPVGIMHEVYDIMVMCWNTDTERRPKFQNLVNFFAEFIKREDVQAEPIPPIRHRLRADRLSVTPSTIADSLPIGEMIDLTITEAGISETKGAAISICPPSTSTVSSTTMSSQATTTTTLPTSASLSGHSGGGLTGGAASGDVASSTSYDSMPTMGDGVTRNLFPPYESKLTETLMNMNGYSRKNTRSYNLQSEPDEVRSMDVTQKTEISDVEAGTSSESSSESNDDSTLHGSMNSSLRYQIRNPLPSRLASGLGFCESSPPIRTPTIAFEPTNTINNSLQLYNGQPPLPHISNVHATPQSAPSWRKEFGDSATRRNGQSLPDSPVDMISPQHSMRATKEHARALVSPVNHSSR